MKSPESCLLHKLGTGRTFGYGSVKIIVTGVEERSVIHNADGTLSYEVKKNPFAFYEPFDIIIDKETKGREITVACTGKINKYYRYRVKR